MNMLLSIKQRSLSKNSAMQLFTVFGKGLIPVILLSYLIRLCERSEVYLIMIFSGNDDLEYLM